MDEGQVPSEPANPYAAPQVIPAEEDGFVTAEGEALAVNPFRTIWTRPRLTIQQVVDSNPKLHVVPLAVVAGIGSALSNASGRATGDTQPLVVILVVAILFGPLGGLLRVWLGAFLVRVTGKWLGGQAPPEQIRAAIAWALVPSALATFFWIPELLLFGEEMFTTETPRMDAQPSLLFVLLGALFIELCLGFWGFVLHCQTIAQVQGYRSAWRGFANILLASVVVVIPLLCLVLGLFVFN